MGMRTKGAETKKKILDAATKIFGKKGYHLTTVAEICELAGVNIASVNYHFGDKEKLYVATWRNAFVYATKKHPPNGGAKRSDPVEVRLKAWIVTMLRRVADPSCEDLAIMNMEMANPTGYLNKSLALVAEQAFFVLDDIVRKWIGNNASEEDVKLCVMSIHSQCINPLVMDIRNYGQCVHQTSLHCDIESLADHIARFSCAGLEQARLRLASS